MTLPRLDYKITRLVGKNSAIAWLNSDEFRERFPVAGHNFQTRLDQIKTFVPDAIDWELEEDSCAKRKGE